MPSKKTKTPIEEGKYYHIFNRGNNFEDVFKEPEDYIFFLEKFKHYMSPYVKTYAYCLNPNHYHFLIQIKNQKDSKSNASNEFRKFILSYTNRINFKYNRSGSLFLRYFKRVEVSEMAYLKRLVYYIHKNPSKHQIMEDFRKYPFSSYRSFISNSATSLDKEEVLNWFGSGKDFIEYHDFLQSEDYNKKMLLED